MKNLFKLIFSLILLLVIFTSCSKEEDFKSETVIGTWRAIESNGWEFYNGKKESWHLSLGDKDFDNFQVSFLSDGTGFYDDNSKFTWNIDGNILYMKDNRDFDVYKLIVKNKNTIVLFTEEKDFYEETIFQKIE